MSWFRRRHRLATPPGTPAWDFRATPAVVEPTAAPVPPSDSDLQDERRAISCALASGITTALAVAVTWPEIKPFPIAFYYLLFVYRYVSPFLWAGTIAFGFGSRSRLVRALGAITVALVAVAEIWPRLTGAPLPFAPVRLAYAAITLVGALLWWRRKNQPRASA